MMPWSCEVLANALTLASPIAACYCARLLTRLFAQLEETSAIVANRNFPQSRSLACSGTEAVLIPPAPCRSESGQHHENQAVNGCFQYSNATFVLQSNDGSGVDAMDAEDEELDFCILTPQQALGVLGDHAPLYAKIFLNGYTFVADQSEPGTILSVDEYADRMHSSASRDQSLGGSSITCSPGDSQVADAKSDADASSRSMGGASSISHFSSISGSLSLTSCNLTSYISCGQPDYSSDPTVSRRSSFEVQLLPSKCSARIQLTRRTTLEEVNVEGSYFNTTSQTCPANLDDVSAPDKAQAHIWCSSAETAAADAIPLALMHPAELTGPSTPRGLATPPRPSPSPHSTGGACAGQLSQLSQQSRLSPADSWVLRRNVQSIAATRSVEQSSCGGNVANKARAGCCGPQRHSRNTQSEALPRSASHGGAVSSHAVHEPVRGCQRRWVPSGTRLVPAPPPLPPPSVACAGGPLSSSSCSRTALRKSRAEAAAASSIGTCSFEVAPVPHSPPQLTQSQPRLVSGGCVTPCGGPPSPASSPAGLGKAPALPLPDGATLESAVPPALRYYLAQARAAGCQDPRDIGEGCEAGVRQRRSSAGDSVTGALSEPGHDGDVSISAGRPGFVRAAVEQLNTQRLVCCHVTPFTASKTSRKPRPLAHRVSASK